MVTAIEFEADVRKRLIWLVGQVIELTISYQPIGFAKAVGRVRYIEDGATLSVGDACFSADTHVRTVINGGTGPSYTVDLPIDCDTHR